MLKKSADNKENDLNSIASDLQFDFTVKQCFFEHSGLKLAYLDCYQSDNHADGYRDNANLQPPVVLLHGFSSSARNNWLNTGWITELVAAKRRVIALDARGHGLSDRVYEFEYYPANVMMTDSIALLAQLDIERADFIGFSMGARMASFAAINYPEKIRRLVIAGMGMNLVEGMQETSLIAEALLAEDLSLIKSKMPRLFRRLAQQNANDLKALAVCISASRVPITLNDLAKITAKTIVVTGDKDELSGSPVLLCEKLLDLGVDISYQLISDCNHFMAPLNKQFMHVAVNHIISS